MRDSNRTTRGLVTWSLVASVTASGCLATDPYAYRAVYVEPVRPAQTVVVQPTADEFQDDDPSALTDFRGELDPYGSWRQDPTYGTVWVPAAAEVGPDFVPYQTNGYWSLTEQDEYLWVSQYRWGHVPFHYGRWVRTAYGWAWIPGRTYAPSWVVWRTNDYGYMGWAPMGPSYVWFGGAPVGWYQPYDPYWSYCPASYFFYPNVHTHVIRDPGLYAQVHAHSTTYGHSHAPAKPQPGHVPAKPKPAYPSPAQARIPATALPPARVPANAAAMAYSRRSTTQQLQTDPAFRATVQGRVNPGPPSPSSTVHTAPPQPLPPPTARPEPPPPAQPTARPAPPPTQPTARPSPPPQPLPPPTARPEPAPPPARPSPPAQPTTRPSPPPAQPPPARPAPTPSARPAPPPARSAPPPATRPAPAPKPAPPAPKPSGGKRR